MVLKRKVIYGGLWGDEVLGVVALKRQTALLVTNFDTASRIIRTHHYSKKTAGIPSPFNFVVEYKGKQSGALQLGYGQNPALNGVLEGHTVEFDRMWLSDDMPKYSETCVIGLLHTYLRVAHPKITRITTYSDTGEGNFGTIYKAANYRFDGETKGAFYRLPDGEKIHRVSLWHRHGKNGNDWEWLRERYPGIERLTAPQLRFVYDLRGTR